MPNIALVDFGSTYTKLTIVNTESETILAGVKSPTTVSTDIMEGFDAAYKEAKAQGQFDSVDVTLACSSAGGGLAIVAIGIVPELTAKAAQMAALNAGGKVIKVFSYELCEEDVAEIDDIKPDIILLTGGTDGGNKTILLHNAKMLATLEGDYRILAACNRSAAGQVLGILRAAGKTVDQCENVMPALERLNIDNARETIRRIFLEDIIKAKGISNVETLIRGILMPTPSAVMNAIEALSRGLKNEDGLSDIIAVDIGGATTDVYSAATGLAEDAGVVLKGFKEPFIKRTVEGDLGVRYNAANIAAQAGIDCIAEFSGESQSAVTDLLEKIKRNYSYLPQTPAEKNIDIALGAKATDFAVTRHCGSHEVIYTPNGAVTVQTGKDLRGAKYIIGTGGPIVNVEAPEKILAEGRWCKTNPSSLRPTSPGFIVDKDYVLSAMGLLCGQYPAAALHIMKKSLRSC